MQLLGGRYSYIIPIRFLSKCYSLIRDRSTPQAVITPEEAGAKIFPMNTTPGSSSGTVGIMFGREKGGLRKEVSFLKAWNDYSRNSYR